MIWINLVVEYIWKKIFRRDDFKFVVNELKKYLLDKFYSQCLRENGKLKFHSLSKSTGATFSSTHWVIYVKCMIIALLRRSHIYQLISNIKCCSKNKLDGKNGVKASFWVKHKILAVIDSPMNSETEFNKWGFTFEDSLYILHTKSKHGTIPFTRIYGKQNIERAAFEKSFGGSYVRNTLSRFNG